MRTAAILGFILMTVVARPAAADLRAGVARVDITPPLGGSMYGYSARGANVSTGVHDPLYAKAIVLAAGDTRLAIVTLDLGSIGPDNTATIRGLVREATGIDDVLLIASHTHSAPTLAPDFPSAEKPYVRDVEQGIARAVIEAAGGLQPARISVGGGRAEEGHNRRKVSPDGKVEMFWENRQRIATRPVDYALAVVAVDTLQGEPIATLVNFACHPVVCGPENLQISADYPGQMMPWVEKQVGGQCMFVQGAAGDINPFWDKTSPADGAYEQMKLMGEALGREAVRVRKAIPQAADVDRISVRRDVVRLEPRWDLEDMRVQSAILSRFGERTLRRFRERFPAQLDAEINTVLIGDQLAIATFPGEFFVEHGMRLKSSSMVRNTIFAGYANGALGYFPTIRAAAEGGYGGKEATIVEVGAGERLVDRALINLHHQAGHLSEVPRF